MLSSEPATAGALMPRRPSEYTGPSPVTPAFMAKVTGMTAKFFRDEIAAGELRASKFGTDWRIPHAEMIRYLRAKQFPIPPDLLPTSHSH